MDANEAVQSMMRDALKAAQEAPTAVTTPEAMAAYARGVRAMAGLVQACVNVADEYANRYIDHPVAGVMFEGYATALRHIVSSADALIPPGYEQ